MTKPAMANLRLPLALVSIVLFIVIWATAAQTAPQSGPRLQTQPQSAPADINATPSIGVTDGISVTFGNDVSIPLVFAGDTLSIASLAFTLNFDPNCLQFDSTDGNNDGIPDSIAPAQSGFSLGISTAAAATGSLRFVIFPSATVPLPALADGALLTLVFGADCVPSTALTLSNASFGTTNGVSVPGAVTGGTVTINAPAGLRGDCNADATVDAADLSGLILEVFDGDGADWLDAPGGTFAGNAKGCDSNEDTQIDAGDIACKIRLLIEGGDVQCSGGVATGSALLSLPSRLNAAPGQILQIPVTYQGDDYNASTLTFAIRFDPARLLFNTEDKDGDTLPDGLTLSTPVGFASSVQVVDASEIQISVYSPTLRRLPSGALATVTFAVREGVEVIADRPALTFSHASVNSLGADNGRSLPLTASGTLYLLPLENDRLIFLPSVARD